RFLRASGATLFHLHFANRILPASPAAESGCQRAQDQTESRGACADGTALDSTLPHLPRLRGFLLRCDLLSLGYGLVDVQPGLRRQLIYLLLNGCRQLSSRDSVTVARSKTSQPRCRADKSTGGCR